MPGTSSTTISRRPFAVGVAIRLGLFIAATVAYPLLLLAFAPAFGCSAQVASDACGLLGLFAGIAIKPLVFLLFVVSFPGLIIHRLRDVGLSSWWCAFVMLMLIADYQFLVFAGASWTFSFALGVIGLNRPDFLFEWLALMVVLSILPGRPGRVDARSLALPAIVSTMLVIAAALCAVIRLGLSYPGLLMLLMPLRVLLNSATAVQPYVLAVLPVIVGATLWPRVGEVPTTRSRDTSKGAVPFKTLALLTLPLPPLALCLVAPEYRSPLFLFVSLGTVLAPTFAVYFGVVLSVYLLAKHRGVVAYLMTLVTVAVLSSWAYDHWAAAEAQKADAAKVASIPMAPLTIHPSVVLVSESGNNDFTRVLLRRSDIDAVVQRDRKGVLTEYRAPPKGHDPLQRTISGLPTTYLRLNAERSSSFAEQGTSYENDGPYELRLVENGTDTLVSLSYRRFIRPPYWLPLLAYGGGWLRVISTDSVDIDKAREAFIIDALGPAPPRA